MFQFPMWPGERQDYLERHDFYVEQVGKRIFRQFDDLPTQADDHTSEQFELIKSSTPFRDDIDLADLAHEAMEQGAIFYGLLKDLRSQMILGALAGLYHQWDKYVRTFIQREIREQRNDAIDAERVWKNGIDILKLLQEMGWDCAAAPFSAHIDAARLIVNVYKHGNGASLEHLKQKYPQYLTDPLAMPGGLPFTDEISWIAQTPDHEWLHLTEAQFAEIATGFRQFWEAFPERHPISRAKRAS